MDPTLSDDQQSPLKFWQKPTFRIAILASISILLLSFYLWKQHQLKTISNQTSQTSNFDYYLTSLVNKLKQPSEPTATSAPLKTPIPTPTPKPLPHGIQIYRFSHGKNVTGPKPTKVIVDPIDPPINTYQTTTITINHNQPVTSAKIILVTDDQSKPIQLRLKSGTSTNGIWTAKYKVNHHYNYNYQIKMIFSDGINQYQGGLTFR